MTNLRHGVKTRRKMENVTKQILPTSAKKLVEFVEIPCLVKTTSPHLGVKTRKIKENVTGIGLNTNAL